MYRMRKAMFCLFVLIFTFALQNGGQLQAATLPGFSISRYNIAVVLQEDGSADVTETISYKIERKLSSFSYEIGYADAGRAQLKGIEVASQKDQSAQPGFVEVQPADAAGNQSRPMTYELNDDGKKLHIVVEALSEEKTTRMVKISYSLAQAVYRQTDAACLERQFFTIGGQAKISQLALTIQLPSAISELQTWSLPISQADWQKTCPQDDQLCFQADRMAYDQSVKLVCLFPLASFDKAAAASDLSTWEAITANARARDLALDRQAGFRSGVYWLIYILLGLSTIMGILIYWFFDRESAAIFRKKYSHEIPSDCPPAIMAVLLYKAKPGRLILSTLIDLVRRGKLLLHGCVFSLPNQEKKDLAGCADFEIFLLNWFFGHITTDQSLSTAKIRTYARDPSTALDFQTYYQDFRCLLDEEVEKRGLLDTTRSQRGRLISLLISGSYLILTIAGILYMQDSVSLLLLVPAAVMAVYSLLIRRLSAVGRELYAKGQALQRTMKCCASIKPLPDSAFFSQALPMAIGLGTDSRLLSQLQGMTTEQQILNEYPLEEYGITNQPSENAKPIQSLINDLSAMESMLSASLLLAAGIHW